ncbi:MAG: hypothetical protein ACREJD_05155 [Phycisphaerales bacterium]
MNLARISIFVAISGLAVRAMAQDAAPSRMTILDRNLQRISAELERLAPSTIQYNDVTGRSRSIERSRVLAIFSNRGHSASLPSALSAGEGNNGIPGILKLTDGQVVPGFLVTSGSPGETVTWKSRRIGRFAIPLERASSILFADVAHDRTKPQRDMAILGNNDRFEGFIEGIGQQLTIEVDGKKNSLPIERVSWLALANPLQPGPLPLVYLSDGSVLTSSEFASTAPAGKNAASSTATAQWALASEGGTGVVDIDSIDAILFDSRAIVPLASIPFEKATGLDGRRWTPTPEVSSPDTAPLGLASITISGPAQVDWKLPAGSAKFGASLSLPPDAAAWGNASVIVLASGPAGTFREVAKADLTSEKPSADLVADVSDATSLRIEIKGKAYSDVQARVTLHQPVLTRKAEAPKP